MSIPKLRRIEALGRRPYYSVHIGGKRRHLGSDPIVAHRRYSELLAAYRGGGGKPVTFPKAAELWLDRHRSHTNTISLRVPGVILRGVALSEVTADVLSDLQGKLLARGLKASTVRNYMQTVCRVLRWAVKRGWLSAAPDKPAPPAIPWLPRDVPIDSLAARLDAMEGKPMLKPALTIFRFILATGCRPGEAIGLRWDEVDLERGVCILPKHKTQRTGRARTIFLTQAASVILRSLPEKRGRVFHNRWGNPYTVAGLRLMCKKHLKCTSNQLRPTFAQEALGQTSLEDVSALLGHVDTKMIRRYAQVRSDRSRRVASTLRLPGTGRTPDRQSHGQPPSSE